MRQWIVTVIMAMTLAGCVSFSSVDLTGDWTISSSVGGEIPITVYCTLVQTGRALSGTCTPEMENPESSDLIGAISGSSAEWGYDVFFNNAPGTVHFDADAISQSDMSGTLNLSGTEAPFTAIRSDL